MLPNLVQRGGEHFNEVISSLMVFFSTIHIKIYNKIENDMVLLRKLLTLILLVSTCANERIPNRYPIILVHGVFGWGRDEMGSLRYFGALQGDFQARLEKQGYKVYTVALGPISSNWDRACELFAQVKGGRVDYGIEHSKMHGHKRFGRTYPGLYRDWGTKDADGNIRKVHLIGHSLGGTTSRLLAQLLSEGSRGSAVNEQPTTTLFEGGHADWIHSITTIATPHDGTTLADVLAITENLSMKFFAGLSAVLGIAGRSTTKIYDFKLDHFGLDPRKPEETLGSYFRRIVSSQMFDPSATDTALHDLTTRGAAKINLWVKAQPNVYHFSYGTSSSFQFFSLDLKPVHLPIMYSTFPPLQPVSAMLGSRATIDLGLSEEWQENDGCVNTISSLYPSVNTTDEAVVYENSARIGVWNHLGVLRGMDHLAVTGWTYKRESWDLYKNHMELIVATEKAAERRHHYSKLSQGGGKHWDH